MTPHSCHGGVPEFVCRRPPSTWLPKPFEHQREKPWTVVDLRHSNYIYYIYVSYYNIPKQQIKDIEALSASKLRLLRETDALTRAKEAGSSPGWRPSDHRATR